MQTLSTLQVKIFADGADRAGMLEMSRNLRIKRFTTNPTLMRKAGVTDYQAFALNILRAIPDRSISLEVFSDDFAEMKRQARTIAAWGENVYVKIPVTTTVGESSAGLVHALAQAGVKLNVTALLTLVQIGVNSSSVVLPSWLSVGATLCGRPGGVGGSHMGLPLRESEPVSYLRRVY